MNRNMNLLMDKVKCVPASCCICVGLPQLEQQDHLTVQSRRNESRSSTNQSYCQSGLSIKLDSIYLSKIPINLLHSSIWIT